jgi:signal transduction histidine kinase
MVGELPAVMVDPGQVAGALLEVLDNALHATDRTDSAHVGVHAAYDPFSARVVVTVADNGCGMDEETVKRAFDPFFSSKRAGRRRGMGLAKALRWVEASGGSIRLESRPGQGTRTVLLLPAVKTDGSASNEVPVATERKVQNL